MSLAPSTRVVVRWSTRVATAYERVSHGVQPRQHSRLVQLGVLTEKAKCQVVRKVGKGKLRLEKTYSATSQLGPSSRPCLAMRHVNETRSKQGIGRAHCCRG